MQEQTPCRLSGSMGHFRYNGRKAARQAAKSHTRAINDGLVRCVKCAQGMEPQVFRCAAAEHIWHWGHGTRPAP